MQLRWIGPEKKWLPLDRVEGPQRGPNMGPGWSCLPAHSIVSHELRQLRAQIRRDATMQSPKLRNLAG